MKSKVEKTSPPPTNQKDNIKVDRKKPAVPKPPARKPAVSGLYKNTAALVAHVAANPDFIPGPATKQLMLNALTSTATNTLPNQAPLLVEDVLNEVDAGKEELSKVSHSSLGPALGSAAKMAEKLAWSICLPSFNNPTMRLGTVYSAAPSSVATLQRVMPCTWGTPSGVGNQHPPGLNNWACFLFRDPVKSLVFWSGEKGFYAYTLPALYGPGQLSNEVYNDWKAGPMGYDVGSLVAGSKKKPFGDFLYPCKSDSGIPYYYINNPLTLKIVNGDAAVAIVVQVLRYDLATDTETQVFQFTVNAATTGLQNFATQTSGYYRWRIKAGSAWVSSSLITASLGIGLTGSIYTDLNDTPCWGALTLRQWYDQARNVAAIRMLGVSLCLTPLASPLNLSGAVAAVQVAQSTNWMTLLDNHNAEGIYNGIASLAQAANGRFQQGMYGYLKPTQPSDFNMASVGEASAETDPADRTFGLINDKSDYLAFAVKCEDPQGQTHQITTVHNVEFRTNNLWFDARVPVATEKLTEEAMQIVRDQPQFCENPNHVEDLVRGVIDTGQGIFKTIKAIGGIFT